MFKEIIDQNELCTEKIHLFYPASNREKWSGIPSEMQSKYIARGEALLHTSWPFLTAEDFLEFSKTGNRRNYGKKYFGKRRALSELVMAECCEYKGKYLLDIINGLYAIAGETAWWVPAHNSYIRDTKQLPLPDTCHPIVELFSAETAALLSMACYLLREKLDEVSPCIVTHINHALCERVINPYLSEHFWWMGNGKDEMNNWTPWCTKNILQTALLCDDAAKLRHKVIEKAAYSLDCFVNSYQDDGCCNEGAQYYQRAALELFGAIELFSATNATAFEGLYQDEKIRNMAAFIHNMHIADKYYFNFADCSPFAGRRGAHEFIFAKRTANAAMQAFAAADFKIALQEPDESGDIERINLSDCVLEAFCSREMMEFNGEDTLKKDIYYPSSGVFIAQDDIFNLGVKAGHNADGHNHNDTGSFILYKNKKPFLIDLGVESYTAKTFSPQRYEIWTMQSAWHNLPTFGGIMQQDGRAFAASDVNVDLDKSQISMNIASAYPKCANLSKYTRKVALNKGENIVLTDETDYDGDVVLSLLTQEKPEVSGQVIAVGALGTINAKTPCVITYEQVNITDDRLLNAWPSTVYRLQITFSREITLIFS